MPHSEIHNRCHQNCVPFHALLCLVLMLFGGCEQPPAELSFESQIEMVKRGESDEIRIHDTVVTNDDMARLQEVPQLRVLDLKKTKIDDRGLLVLAQHENLHQLALRGAKITDAGIEHLVDLPKLAILNLPDAKFTNKSLERLQQLKKLELLRFGSPNVTNEGLGHLCNYANLRFLHLINSPIGDAGLAHVSKIPKLESFYLDGGNATNEGLVKLYESTPKLHIHVDQKHLDSDPNAHKHD
ncbi:MAG: hypothetical protein ACI9G1_003064 [Pirellulaceae bacterium]|jgi:hypothetical protein